MFVEGDVEVTIKDRSAAALGDHELKLWLQRAFKDMSCYRISHFRKEGTRAVHATVALKLSVLPDNERNLIETHPHDKGLLRSFLERMFEGKGSCRALGDPQLKAS